MPLSQVYNIDCMEYMATVPDGYFDIAIVDPPYGLDKKSTQGSGKLKERVLNRGNISTWDVTPSEEYFAELRRVSKHQVIWGGNYFPLPPTRCVVVWDKQQVWPNFSQCEIAWTSYDKPAKLVTIPNRGGHRDEQKFHPTQKPVELYAYLLSTFGSGGGVKSLIHTSVAVAVASRPTSWDTTSWGAKSMRNTSDWLTNDFGANVSEKRK